MNNILLFDFDGTIALGDGPVLAYAHQVGAALGDRDDFVHRIRIALEGADAGALDGYDAVRRAAREVSDDASLLSAAYLASRRQLATADAPISAPVGLADFLRRADAERILVTNAPDVRIVEALDTLGLTGLFDRIVTSAKKPKGLEAILDALPTDARVLSIGDIWRNDLAPAHARGHATALVGQFTASTATPTYRAADFASLIPEIDAWLRATDAPSTELLPPTEVSTPTEG